MLGPRTGIAPILFFYLFSATLGFAAVESSGWKAGVSKVVITPSESVWMAGYAGRGGPSDGVLVDLYARVLVLSDAKDKRLVILTMDLIEIPNSLRDLILQVARENHGLQPEELLINVSHTHGGPMVSAKTVIDWGLDPVWANRADHYVQELVKKIDGLIGRALSSQQNAMVTYSHARCGFAMNRRQSTPDGFRLGPNPDGPVDHDVPVLKITTKEDNLIAIVFGYACHNTALGPTLKFNGDYAGFAQRKLDRDHPEVVSLFLMGCGGDQDPAPRRSLEDAEQNGLALASAVEAALIPAQVTLSPSISVGLANCPLNFAPLRREELERRAKSGDGFVSRHAQWVLKMWPSEDDHPEPYQLPIQVVSLGQELTIIALGGEPVVDYSILLKQKLSTEGKRIWVAGYSNLVNAYIPNRRVLKEGGYEGTEAVIYQSLPSPFTQDIEDRIVSTIHRLVAVLNKNE